MRRRARTYLSVAAICSLSASLLPSCAPSGQALHDQITVTGVVSVRGNVPFTRLMMTTDDNNHYVLVFTQSDEDVIRRSLPGRLTVTGRLYADDWGMERFAHVDVRSWRLVDE